MAVKEFVKDIRYHLRLLAREINNSSGGSLTAAEIKTLYESNADTNAFTDAEQTKLAGLSNSPSGVSFFVKTADQTVSNSAQVTDTDVVVTTLTADTLYRFVILCSFNFNTDPNTSAMEFSISTNAGTTGQFVSLIREDQDVTSIFTSDLFIQSPTQSWDEILTIKAEGFFRPIATGSLGIVWGRAFGASPVGNITLLKDSYMMIMEV